MMDIIVDNLGFSNRTRNALRRGNVNTLSELMALSEDDFLNLNNMGRKSVDEVLAFQERYKLRSEEVLLEGEEEDTQGSTQSSRIIYIAFPEYVGKDLCEISYKIDDGKYAVDVELTKTGLSTKTVDALNLEGYKLISQVAYLELNSLKRIKNIGAQSAEEVIRYFQTHAAVKASSILLDSELEELLVQLSNRFLDVNEIWDKRFLKALKIIFSENDNKIKNLKRNCDIQALVESPEFVKAVWKSNRFKEEYREYILHNIDDLNEQNISEKDVLFSKIGLYQEVLEELVFQKKLENHKGVCKVRIPHVDDWIESISNPKHQMAIKLRLAGKKLEECGQYMELTRERVRQMIAKEMKRKPQLREDDYKEMFEKYFLDKEAFLTIFDESEQTYFYLCMAYKHGREPINNMLDDTDNTGGLLASVNNYVHKDSVWIEDEYIRCKRECISKKLAKMYCANQDVSYDDFYDIYMSFIEKNRLNGIDALLYPTAKAFTARMEGCSFILNKYGRRLRYYPIEEIAIDELVEALNFDQYQNVEISSLKLFNENKELMEEYDLRDEYEIHCLLKKTEKIWNQDHKVRIQRTPFLAFGDSDRARQTWDLLYKFAPLSVEEFCHRYEEEYGVLARTVLANFIPYVSGCVHEGMLILNLPLLNEIEKAYLKSVLLEDFYFTEDVKKVYSSRFGNAGLDKINTQALLEVGYRTYRNYIISTRFTNAFEYFNDYWNKKEIVELDKIDRRLRYTQMCMETLEKQRRTYQLLEYADMKFIRMSRLQSVYPDISKQMLEEYVSSAINYAGDEQYYTVKLLKKKGFTHRLHQIGLEEWFNSALLMNSHKLRFIKFGGNIVFYNGKEHVTTLDFIRYLIKKLKKIDVYDFVQYLEEEFGVSLQKEKIIQLVKKTNAYYDPIMEKLYDSKMLYYEEI